MKTVLLLGFAAILLFTATGCTIHRVGISAGHGEYYHYRSPHKVFQHHKPLHHSGRPVIIIPHHR